MVGAGNLLGELGACISPNVAHILAVVALLYF
jgi:hypothetical protein